LVLNIELYIKLKILKMTEKGDILKKLIEKLNIY